MSTFQQTFWKYWYQYLTGRVNKKRNNTPVTFLNYGYWPEEGETVKLKPQDEPNRPTIQLYHHVASGSELRGKDVLEVSCGHGGGASFVKRYHLPGSYTAIDQNAKAIEYCRAQHGDLGIDFLEGDAQVLAFTPESFDAIVNVEASHCYPDLPAYFQAAYKVLRPGGHLLLADFRTQEQIAALDAAIAGTGFKVVSKTDITPHVLRALKRMSAGYSKLVTSLTPRFLHKYMLFFAATEGSAMHTSFESGERSYLSYRLQK